MAAGVFWTGAARVQVDIASVEELLECRRDVNLNLGAAVTLTEVGKLPVTLALSIINYSIILFILHNRYQSIASKFTFSSRALVSKSLPERTNSGNILLSNVLYFKCFTCVYVRIVYRILSYQMIPL